MKRLHHQILATLGAAGLCAATLGVAGPANADPAPYQNGETGTTSTYSSVTGSFTWDEARADAAATPAPAGCRNHLAVITSAAEQQYVDDNLGSQWGQFIGAQRGESGSFEWVTGEPLVYSHWADGEPNDTSPGEPYAQLAAGNLWNDIFFYTTSGYILETECDGPVTPGPLAVTGVDPTSGSQAGGDTVTITGSGFTGATGVLFGAKKATSVTVVSDTKITATVPAFTGKVPQRGKTVHVRVKVGKSTSAKSSADLYKYTRVSAG